MYLDTAVRECGATGRGCAIVMDAGTGAVLAMAVKPDYDLNQPRELNDYGRRLLNAAAGGQDEQLLAALQSQWKNKAVSEFYEPGSVFKSFTASMGLELGLVTETTPFYCRGYYSMPGAPLMKCHVYPRSHGSQTFAEAISHSCNPAFMTLGGMVGGENFSRFFEAFGFTERTGIDLLGEARVTPSLYHTAERITPLDVATSSIGQTFKVTPIQMITAMCALTDGGELLQPYVVQRVTAPDGSVVAEQGRTVRRRVVSQQTAQRMCALLEGVVDGGGVKNAYVAGYRVGGKTGTSVKTDSAVQADGRKNVVASFMGIAPADDPQAIVLVLIDEPQTAIRYGGTLAAPVAQQIFSQLLPYLGVEPRYTEKEQKQLARIVPDITGLTAAKAQQALEKQGLKLYLSGDGTSVLRQNPPAGEPIRTGGRVVAYTSAEPARTVTVPALIGGTLAAALSKAADAGLNLLIDGFEQDAGTAFIAAQSVPAGETVPLGTALTVRLLYKDSIE